MSEWIIGIDPGKSGGMAMLCSSKSTILPLTNLCEADISTVLDDWAHKAWAAGDMPFAYIEKVASSPQMGVKSAFTFGQGYGFLRGCLYAAGVAFEEVTPAKWQRAMGCRTKGDKNVTKAKAQQLFPGIKITHAIADALLIAEYGRRLRGGTL